MRLAWAAREEASSSLLGSVGGSDVVAEGEAVHTLAVVGMDRSLHCVLARSLADGVEVEAEHTSLAVVVVHNLGLAVDTNE